MRENSIDISAEQALLKKAYNAFNSRDIEGTLELMHPAVIWPNRIDGGYIHGLSELREYWTRHGS